MASTSSDTPSIAPEPARKGLLRASGRVLLVCGLILASLAASLTLADMALGALGYAREWSILTRAPDQLIVGRTRFVSNAEGAPDFPVGPRQPGERRGMITGDSLTEGWNVNTEDRYSAYMQEALGFRVINAAMGGKEPHWYLYSFDHFAPKYQPDYYFIPVFANDLIETEPGGDNYQETVEFLYRQNHDAFPPLDRWIRAAWPHAFVLLQKKVSFYPDVARLITPTLPALLAAEPAAPTPVIDRMMARARQQNATPERIAEWRARLTPEDAKYLETVELSDGIREVAISRPWYWSYNLDVEGEKAEGSWKTLTYQMNLLIAHARERGIKPYLIFLPHPVQYDPDYIKPIYLRLGVVLRKEWYGAPSEFQRRVEALAAKNGVPYFDGQAAFLAYQGPKTDLYFSHIADPHMPAKGARVLGQAIAAWLRAGRLLDETPKAQ